MKSSGTEEKTRDSCIIKIESIKEIEELIVKRDFSVLIDTAEERQHIISDDGGEESYELDDEIDDKELQRYRDKKKLDAARKKLALSVSKREMMTKEISPDIKISPRQRPLRSTRRKKSPSQKIDVNQCN